MARSIVHFSGDDVAQLALVRRLRFEAFCVEQGVSADIELDGLDGECVHYLLREDQIPAATSRVRPIGTAIFKLERMAVRRESRRGGLGRDLMRYILDDLRRNGATTVVLHAQTQVEEFYRGLGFISEGEVYMEAGIPHRTMRRDLRISSFQHQR